MKIFLNSNNQKESLLLIGVRVYRVIKSGNTLHLRGIFDLPTELKDLNVKDIQLMCPEEYQEFCPAMISNETTDGSINYTFVQYNIEVHGVAELFKDVIKEGLDEKFKAKEQVTSGKVAKDTKSIPMKLEKGKWSVYFVDDANKELNQFNIGEIKYNNNQKVSSITFSSEVVKLNEITDPYKANQKSTEISNFHIYQNYLALAF